MSVHGNKLDREGSKTRGLMGKSGIGGVNE